MKKLFIIFFMSIFSVEVMGDTHVKGYTRKDGTYVAPHYRSDPNSSRLDNWSTRGNINPYTGKLGTKDPYAQDNSSKEKLYNSQENLNDRNFGNSED